MLRRLTVKNLAVVEKVEVDFAAGLNVITGETGAGKSVLMGALELVLGGRATALVHAFLTGESLAPPEVGRRALHGNSETLHWYARFYGRACRNWVLSSLCRGGLWIAGGIAAANPLCVTHKAFAEAYLAPGKVQAVVTQTPVYLMTNSMSGLWGAARLGSQALP